MLNVGNTLFVVCILRPLAATHMVIGTDYETYVAGPVSKALAILTLLGGFNCYQSRSLISLHIGAKIHVFLSQTDYKNPEGPTGVFRYTKITQLPFFPWIMQHPTKLTSFLTMPED